MAGSKGRREAPADEPSGILPIFGVVLVVAILYAIISAF